MLAAFACYVVLYDVNREQFLTPLRASRKWWDLFKMKKLLIFDAYGTLISTGSGSLDAAEKILSLQEKDISAQEFYSQWKALHRKHIDCSNESEFISEQDIFVMDLKALYEQYSIQRPYKADAVIMLHSLYGRSAFPEVSEAIERLRRIYRVVIGSTTDTKPLISNIEYNNLIFDAVYTSEIIGKYKPHRDFYRYILQKENCRAENTVFIGDSLTDDISGPQSLGITTVLVDRNGKYRCAEGIRPDYIVNSIGEIADLDFMEVPHDNP